MLIDDIVWQYRKGRCFAMAKALHNALGWEMRYIQWGGALHAFVISPAGEVLDIHGLFSWEAYQTFLVGEFKVPDWALEQGVFKHEAFTPDVEDLFSRLYNYRPPSKTAITQARRDVQKHPNTAAPFDTLTKSRKGA